MNGDAGASIPPSISVGSRESPRTRSVRAALRHALISHPHRAIKVVKRSL